MKYRTGWRNPEIRDLRRACAAAVCLWFLLAGTIAASSAISKPIESYPKWHTVTLSFTGPETAEDAVPNPFTDYRLDVVFSCGNHQVIVLGYYAADGNASETGAAGGSVWRVHFTPDREGIWNYRASFRAGSGVALNDDRSAGKATAFDGATGEFTVGPCDASAPGFRSKGMLRYTGERYLRFAETGEYFLKGGADSPENFLAYVGFDQTPPTHAFTPHERVWRPGDPAWRGERGKGIIGALNYLASKGMNSVYFITMNVEGDGKDVWPWNHPGERFRFDCSKLDQWEIVFKHMDALGLMLHVVTQEQENDQLLDGGDLGPQRRLYYRELAARFGHHLGLVWNLGEENTNTDDQRKAFAGYLRKLDAYAHPIVVHTFPGQYKKVYSPLLGFSCLEGPSLQMGDMTRTHAETLTWVARSAEGGRPWFVCLDEIGPSDIGVKPDSGDPEHDAVRRHALWGNLMAGGAGCEWFFQNDIGCEDWRSRDRMWDLTRHALAFFQQYVPFPKMQPDDSIIAKGNAWCLAKPGEVYVVYRPEAQAVAIVLPKGAYAAQWYNPRAGGALVPGITMQDPGEMPLGAPPGEPDKDWVALLRRVESGGVE